MDEPTQRDEGLTREQLDPRAALLLEQAAEIMGMGSGPWALDVELEDGRIRRHWRKEGPLGRSAMGRYDVEDAAV